MQTQYKKLYDYYVGKELENHYSNKGSHRERSNYWKALRHLARNPGVIPGQLLGDIGEFTDDNFSDCLDPSVPIDRTNRRLDTQSRNPTQEGGEKLGERKST